MTDKEKTSPEGEVFFGHILDDIPPVEPLEFVAPYKPAPGVVTVRKTPQFYDFFGDSRMRVHTLSQEQVDGKK